MNNCIHFSSFFKIPDYQFFYGSYYQISIIFRKEGIWFDASGIFMGEKNDYNEFIKEILKREKQIPYLLQFPEYTKRFVYSNNMSIFIFSCLCHHPTLFTIPGRLAFWLFKDLKKNISTLSLSNNEIPLVLTFLQNKFSPNYLNYSGEGSNNIIYKMDIPLKNRILSLAIRTFKPGKKRIINPYDKQIEMHKKLSNKISTSINKQKETQTLLNIPNAFFKGGGGTYMVTEYIKNAPPLEEAVNIMIPKEIENLKQIVSNTLDFWEHGNNNKHLFVHRDFHGGNVIVELNNDNRMRNAYAIDFDFSVYKPSCIAEDELYTQEKAGTRINYEKDTHIFKYF